MKINLHRTIYKHSCAFIWSISIQICTFFVHLDLGIRTGVHDEYRIWDKIYSLSRGTFYSWVRYVFFLFCRLFGFCHCANSLVRLLLFFFLLFLYFILHAAIWDVRLISCHLKQLNNIIQQNNNIITK